jgi:hemoglobin
MREVKRPAPVRDLDEKSAFTSAHFERWLSLFHETLALGWVGPHADRAAELADNVARVHSEHLIGAPVAFVR